MAIALHFHFFNLNFLNLAGVVQRLERGTHKPQKVVQFHSPAKQNYEKRTE